MDKRTLLAVVLSMGILLGWQFFMTPTPPMDPEHQQQLAAQSVDNTSTTTTVTTPVETSTTNNSLVASTVNEPISIKSDVLDITFDNATGDIKSASILGWDDVAGDPVTFNKGMDYNYYTLSTPIATGYTLNVQKTDNATIVSYTAAQGSLVVTKEYTLENGSYLVKTKVITSNAGETTLTVPVEVRVGAGIGKDFEESNYIFEGAMISNSDKTYRVDATDEDTETLAAPSWVGYTSKYFLFAAASPSFEMGKISPAQYGEVASANLSLTVNPGDRAETEMYTYIGPKEYNLVRSFGMGLQTAIDFGWFYFLAIPMLQIMIYFNGIFNNYGIAIIMLTVIVKIVTLPLTLKGMTSMKAMSKLQPEMQKIKEKFKDNPQKMNQATMELYKEHKVNPLSGCLPLVIQIPIFFALYKALLLAIELKGAPFFGWIVDLSMKDPYYITPIIMGITMFVQQKMTPTTADPMQQKIFLIMPVVFTFLFLNFPSGLVIYWLTNNVLTIIQQYVINKRAS